MDLTMKVPKKEVLEFVRDHNVFWMPTSAATSENVEKLTPSSETVIKNATWKCNDGNNFTLNYTNTQKDDSYRLAVHIANRNRQSE